MNFTHGFELKGKLYSAQELYKIIEENKELRAVSGLRDGEPTKLTMVFGYTLDELSKKLERLEQLESHPKILVGGIDWSQDALGEIKRLRAEIERLKVEAGHQDKRIELFQARIRAYGHVCSEIKRLLG